MSAKLITHIRRRPLSGGLEAVGAMIGGRNAGTYVVPEGRGSELVAVLMSERVVERARAVVARHRGTGDLPALLDALDELAGALDGLDRGLAVEATIQWPELAPSVAMSQRNDESDAEFRARASAELGATIASREPQRLQRAHPWERLVEANNQLYFGNAEGEPGDSVFLTVAVLGAGVIVHPVTGAPTPHAWASLNANQDHPACIRALAERMREVSEDLIGQAEALDSPTLLSPGGDA